MYVFHEISANVLNDLIKIIQFGLSKINLQSSEMLEKYLINPHISLKPYMNLCQENLVKWQVCAIGFGP